MATPARPAAPSCATLVDAPLEEDEDEGEEDDDVGVDGLLVPTDLPVEVLVVEVPVLTGVEEPPGTEVMFVHEVELPAEMVKGADWATVPVPSRSVKPMYVLAEISTVQVYEVALVAGKDSIA